MKREMYIDQALMSTEEVSEYLNLSITTVYKLMKGNDFPSVRIGRKIFTPKQYLDRWIENHMQQGGTDNE